MVVPRGKAAVMKVEASLLGVPALWKAPEDNLQTAVYRGENELTIRQTIEQTDKQTNIQTDKQIAALFGLSF